MRRIWNKHLHHIYLLLITCLYLGLSYIPVIQNYRNTPPERTYLGTSSFDLTGNMTSVLEGYYGHFLRFSKITSTIEGPGTLLKMEYIFIGHLSRILSIDPLLMFHITRTLIGMSFLLVIYLIARRVFTQKFILATGITIILFNTAVEAPGATEGILYYMFIDSHPLVRVTTAMHHYMLGGIFSLLSLYFLGKSLDKLSTASFFSAVLFGFLAAYVYAPASLLVLTSVGMYTLLDTLTHLRSKAPAKTLAQKLSMTFIYTTLSLLPILYAKFVLSKVWDYTAFAHTEQLVYFHLDSLLYLQSIGPVYIASFFALPYIIKKRSAFLWMMYFWLLIHPVYILIISSELLGINKIRFYATAYFVIFGILATLGIASIAQFVKQKLSIPKKPTMAALTLLILLPSIFAYTYDIQRLTECFCKPMFYDWGYPKTAHYEPLLWLRENTNEDDIVLSDTYAGTLMMAYSGNRVFTTEWFRLTDLPEYYDRRLELYTFFNGTMKEERALAFLNQYNISYIHYGPMEMRNINYHGDLPYSFLQNVWENTEVKIYQVIR